MTALCTRYRTDKDGRYMRTLLGESQIPWQCREVFQLLTTSDRYFEHLEDLFGYDKQLSDDFVLRHSRSPRLHCRSIDIDGIPSELLAEIGKQYHPKLWLDCFHSTDVLVFVVPLPAYCLNYSAFTTPLVSEMHAFWCIVR